MSRLLDYVKRYWAIGLGLIAVLTIGYVGYGCGKRSRDNEVADLTTKVAESEKTIEIKDGLYATSLVEKRGLATLLDINEKQVLELAHQLSDSKAQLLTTQEVVVRWKKAYEGAVNATQTNVPPAPPDPDHPNPDPVVRKRVDFTKDFGPIAVAGYTITDPPEGHVSVTQTRPLKLTVAVARNKDGAWQSYVTSSEPDIGVDVSLGGVDPGILDPKWYQRLWLDAGVDFLMGQQGTLGLSYHLDRFSVGADCSAWQGGHGCGLTAGVRIFK